MDRGRRKEILVGAEEFVEVRTGGYYYVDKTGLIRDLIHKKGKVTLFTRPRRFGKSLNMSMLKAFFEIGGDPSLFEGLEIAGETSLCEKYMGKFPVISVSFKDICADSYLTAHSMLIKMIKEETVRQKKKMDNAKLDWESKETLASLLSESMDDADIYSSLRSLTRLLYGYYGQKAIILIDEYDVPLAKASESGYYDQMLALIRGMLSQALKTNSSLQFAILTGCLRISKDSVFTGLNNILAYSVMDAEFSRYFGFTEEEVHSLLKDYSLSSHEQELKDWYDGYHFGNTEVYCPWDVFCHCKKLCADPEAEPEDYWINTSGNQMIRTFIQMSKGGFAKFEMEQLIAGEAVEKEIHQNLTYHDLYGSMENMWDVLLATGYLTCRGEAGRNRFRLTIPNKEIQEIFVMQVIGQIWDTIREDGAAMEAFCTAVQEGNTAKVERHFQEYLSRTISIHDYSIRNSLKENFYHGILLSLLGFRESWVVSSNRETGEGYSDIMIEIEEERLGILIEVKYPQNENMEAACQEALEQIERNRYDEYLRNQGMQTILKYGIACWKKRCKVVLEKEGENKVLGVNGRFLKYN